MSKFILIFLFIFLAGCATDGSFQIPSFSVEDKEKGNLIGCISIPERNVQKCDYEDDKRKWSVEIPLPKSSGNGDTK